MIILYNRKADLSLYLKHVDLNEKYIYYLYPNKIIVGYVKNASKRKVSDYEKAIVIYRGKLT